MKKYLKLTLAFTLFFNSLSSFADDLIFEFEHGSEVNVSDTELIDGDHEDGWDCTSSSSCGGDADDFHFDRDDRDTLDDFPSPDDWGNIDDGRDFERTEQSFEDALTEQLLKNNDHQKKIEKLRNIEANGPSKEYDDTLSKLEQAAFRATNSINSDNEFKFGIDTDDDCSGGFCGLDLEKTLTDDDLNGYSNDPLMGSDEAPDSAPNKREDSKNEEIDLDDINLLLLPIINTNLVDIAPYTSPEATKLESVRTSLDKVIPQGVHQAQAKKEAYKNLRAADNRYLQNENTEGDEYYQSAKFLLDLATDLIPFTSLPKDVYKAVTGLDPIDGRQLSNLERGISAASAIASGATLGAAGVAIGAVKNAYKAANLTKGQKELADRIATLLAQTGTEARVAIEGTSGKNTIIGRDMVSVRNMAKDLKSNGVDIEIYELGADAADEWRFLTGKYNWIPDDITKQSKAYAENKDWIAGALEKGNTIIDIGNPLNKDKSIFYDMELNLIEDFIKGKK